LRIHFGGWRGEGDDGVSTYGHAPPSQCKKDRIPTRPTGNIYSSEIRISHLRRLDVVMMMMIFVLAFFTLIMMMVFLRVL